MKSDLIQRVVQSTGCSRATVYRALQGSPLVAKETRRRVSAAAADAGLVLNPLVGEWMAQLRKPTDQFSKVPLVYLAGHSPRTYDSNPFLTAAWEGVRQRASELGFSSEIWFVGEARKDYETVRERILERCISAVVVSRFPTGALPVELPWEEISAVAIGFTALRPQVHTVASHGFETMRRIMEDLYQRGYRRPGFAANVTADRLGGRRHSADFLACRELFPETGEVPVFRELIEGRRAAAQRSYLRWFRKFQPDVVLSGGIADYLVWLRKAGIRVPEDVGYFHIGLRPDFSALQDASGIPQPSLELGRASVDVLSSLVYRGEQGLPDVPLIVQVQLPLHEGATLHKRR